MSVEGAAGDRGRGDAQVVAGAEPAVAAAASRAGPHPPADVSRGAAPAFSPPGGPSQTRSADPPVRVLAAPDPARTRGRVEWGDLVVVLAVLAVFSRTLTHDFVNWDDGVHVYFNEMVEHPGRFSWWERLTTPAIGYAIPLPILVNGWLWAAGGGAAWPFHALSMSVHAGLAFGLRRLLRSEGVFGEVATFAALAFALHPIVVEPVAWATGLKDLLLGVGALSVLALRHRPLWALGAVIVSFGCKPSAALLSLPMFAAVTEAWQADQTRRSAANAGDGGSRPSVLSRIVLACVGLALGLGLIAWTAANEPDAMQTSLREGTSAWRVWGALGLQIQHLLVPASLAPRYLPDAVGPVQLLLGMLAIIAVGAAAIFAWRRGGPALAYWAVALAVYAPASNVRPLVRFSADSYAYVPWMAACGACALLITRVRAGDGGPRASTSDVPGSTSDVPASGERARGPSLRVVAGLVVCSWAALSLVQVGVWRDSVSLWREAHLANPQDGTVVVFYGEQLAIAGRYDEELALYLENEDALVRARKIPPALVAYLQRQGEIERAAVAYAAAFASPREQDAGLYWHYVEFVGEDPGRHEARHDAALAHALTVWVSRPRRATRDPQRQRNIAALAARLGLPPPPMPDTNADAAP